MSDHTVVLVDDHPPLRAGVAAILESSGLFRVTDQVGSVAEALEAVRLACPDVLVVDVSLPDGNGLDLVRLVRSTQPGCRILVLSMHAVRRIADDALEAGADGYLLKESTAEHLVSALERIIAGDTVIDSRLAPLADSGCCSNTDPREHGGLRRLSDREYQVFVLLASGRNVKEIAAHLGISPKTVDNHRASIMEKLGAGSVADLVRMAIRSGAIAP